VIVWHDAQQAHAAERVGLALFDPVTKTRIGTPGTSID
jgi:hypothetical protein